MEPVYQLDNAKSLYNIGHYMYSGKSTLPCDIG